MHRPCTTINLFTLHSEAPNASEALKYPRHPMHPTLQPTNNDIPKHSRNPMHQTQQNHKPSQPWASKAPATMQQVSQEHTEASEAPASHNSRKHLNTPKSQHTHDPHNTNHTTTQPQNTQPPTTQPHIPNQHTLSFIVIVSSLSRHSLYRFNVFIVYVIDCICCLIRASPGHAVGFCCCVV